MSISKSPGISFAFQGPRHQIPASLTREAFLLTLKTWAKPLAETHEDIPLFCCQFKQDTRDRTERSPAREQCAHK